MVSNAIHTGVIPRQDPWEPKPASRPTPTSLSSPGLPTPVTGASLPGGVAHFLPGFL